MTKREMKTMSKDPYIELEEAWQNGDMSYSEACEIAREMGYDDE